MTDINALQSTLGYFFNDISLLRQALTHRSFINENTETAENHNERLEFLGDSVLNLSLTTILLKRYPTLSEGRLSKMRATLVSEKRLASLSVHLGLGAYLLIGKGEDRTGGREKPSLLADTFEALLGAIYLDGGFNKALDFIDRLFQSQWEGADQFPSQDFKTLLQEFCQAELKTVPNYRVYREEGPDHQKIFFMEVTIQGKIVAKGKGRTKKEAQQKAAGKALIQMTDTLPDK
jgi:ribonuclease III